MRWATVDNIKDQLTAKWWEQMTREMDDALGYTQEKIEAATEEVASYIMPLYREMAEDWNATTCPKRVRDATVALTIVSIVTRRANPLAPSDTSTWEREAANARQWLRRVASGEVELVTEDTVQHDTKDRASVSGSGRKGVF